MIFVALLTILAATAMAAPFSMCEDPVTTGNNCTFITPTLNCTAYTYDIFNVSGASVVTNASLAQLNNSLWTFNFTQVQETNEFVVKLCDGTTREVLVRDGDDTMTVVAIALIVIGIVFLIYKSSIELDDKRHWQMKMLLFYGALTLGWAATNLTLRFAVDASFPALTIMALETFYYAYTIIGLVMVLYLGVKMFAYGLLMMTNIANVLLNRKPKTPQVFDREGDEPW